MNALFWRHGRAIGKPNLLAGTAICATLIFGAASFPAIAATYTFSGVKIEGNSLIEPATITKLAGITKGKPMSDGQLNDATQRLTDSGLFSSVEVIPSGGTLLIKVVENVTVGTVVFEGNQKLKDEQLSELVSTKPRRVYSPSAAERDAALIADTYAQSGRLAARVEPRVILRDNNSVDVVFQIREGKVSEVERLAFIGNRAFSDRRLRQILQTKQAGLLRAIVQRDTFVPDRTELDKQLLIDFYRSRGYIDATVQSVTSEFTNERDGFFLTFTVNEGLKYRFAKITTHSEVEGLDPADYARLVKVKSGVDYSPNAIDRSIARMEALLLRNGIQFVAVEPRITRNPANQTLDVDFVLVRGPRILVERIDIEGNATTQDKVIRRQFRTVEGDPLNPREIRQGAERIRALDFFETADVEARSGTSEDRVIVDVNVKEKLTGSFSFGASVSGTGGFGLTASLSQSNFLGRGQGLDLSISTTAKNQNNSVTFVEPGLLDRDLKLTLDAYLRTTDRDFAFFETERVGVGAALEFPITELAKLDVHYRLSRDVMKNVDPASSPVLLADEARGAEVSSTVGYKLSYDTRINGIDPNNSFLVTFGQDFSGLGGDIDALRTSASATYQTKLFHEEVTLKAELEGGVISALGGGSTRYLDRFTSTNRVRGFEPNGFGPRDNSVANADTLGGNMFAALRVEAKFPVGLPEEYNIFGGVFGDIGSVWGLDNPGTVDDSMHLRSSIGFSLFWESVIGPLRFDFSKPLKKESYDKTQRFDFSISTKF
ncbi:MAG: outer membrane protein assembly factor BamA [Paracoccaceae bacterium]